MFHLKGFSTILLMMVMASSIFAQSAKIKRAKEDMADLNYIDAIEILQNVLKAEDNAEAKINLAECYRKINDTENAEYWYGQVVRLPEAQPIHRLYYGMMLQINGKCDLAKEWYDQYTKEVPDDVRGQYLVKACDYEDELMTKNAGIFEIAPMPFNSNLDDYTPTIHKNSIIFASDRDKGSAVKRKNMWTGNPFTELYSVDFKEAGEHPGAYQYGRPEKFSKKLNTKYHEAAVSFSADGKSIYFTRNNFLNGKEGKSDEGLIKLKVYFGSASGDDWSNLESLPFNSDEYSVAHPTINPDGTKLYFASDMPGGFGGMDLYVSEQESGRWGPPVNLGPSVNTEGNELFPYFEKSGRLYFASDGHIGLGGLDNFYTTEKGMGEWNIPVNLGYPVNTNHDDFAIVFNEDGTWGYFTSDREGGAGRDDVYGFKKNAAPVEIYVFDETTKEPIANAAVLNSLTGNTLTTGTDGKAALDMKLNECADFTANKDGYEAKKQQGCTKTVNAGEVVRVEIPMSKIMDFDIEGIVFDMTTGLPALGAKVTISNDCGKPVAQAITTDESGRYKFKLDKECCYSVKAEKEGFITTTADNNCTKGLTQKTTLNANLNLQPMRPEQLAGTDKPGTTDPKTEPGMAGGDPKKGKDKPKKDPVAKGPKYNEATGLYENPDGTPANAENYNGYVIRDGMMYDKAGKPVKPGKSTFPTGPEGDSYLLHIYYDFDQASIRDESEPELQKLLKMMKDNPDFIVEVSSHTDSRGSDGYNYRLSQRRAESVIAYCQGKGISRDRLIARGFGESKHVNNCVNKVPCSEKEHQMNRRTEFRILGCKGGTDITISHPKDNPRVDPCEGCPF